MYALLNYYKTRLIIILVLVLALSLAATSGFIYWRNTHYVCYSSLLVDSHQSQAALMLAFVIKGDVGTVMLKGNVRGNGQTYSVSRTEDFSITRSENWYQVRSIKLDKSPADNVPTELITHLLPEFYNHTNSLFEFTVTPQGWNGFIYSTGVIPSFYCRRG